MTIDFEHEVILPKHPFNAARLYLAIMAYPERGAELPGGAGAEFTETLLNYALWSTRKFKGLKWMREQFCDRSYTPPTKDNFEGSLARGMRRVDRRLAAFDIIGNQMINGFFAVRRAGAKAIAEGREDEAFFRDSDGRLGPVRPEIWAQQLPTYRQVLRTNPVRWQERLALNTTGSPSDLDQKLKDLQRRAFSESIPVIHMAHGLNQAAYDCRDQIGWAGRHPALALMMNAELWIESGVRLAEQWRAASRHHFTPDLRPDRMVKLLWEKTAE